jgi:hypothetical protein
MRQFEKPVPVRTRWLIGGVLAVFAFVALNDPQPAFPSVANSAVVKSYIYSAKGRLVGHIERTGPWGWDVSDGCNSGIELVADNNRMIINEGFHYYGFAKRRSARRWDVYDDGSGYSGSIRRVSRTRWDVYRGGRRVGWNVYKGGRRVGHAKGSGLNAVAAGFAYIHWFGAGCFDL